MCVLEQGQRRVCYPSHLICANAAFRVEPSISDENSEYSKGMTIVRTVTSAALFTFAITTVPSTALAAGHTAAVKKTVPVKTHTYTGPSVNMRWGLVQVTIVVKGKVVTSLTATGPTERPQSAFINQQAIPMLRQEVMQAKTAAAIKNIYAV